ncbi:glycosyltransferase family 39 protein [Patescibacteria group bacterium]|nr:glycosyltransferase family 39 protein [Patescibacteria group bacterium]
MISISKRLLNTKFLIVVILAIAAFMRLYRIQDYMTFLGDEGRDVLVVYNILHGHLTLLGPTASVGGFFLGPIYYYFMTPFLLLFNYNPVGPAVMVALFGIATVWLVFKVGSELINQRVGIIAAFLYAISPIIIAYSRSSWNPNIMPFFSLLTLYVLYKALQKDNSKLFILCGIFLGVAMQLHYLSVFLGVVIAAYVFSIRLVAGIKNKFKKNLGTIIKDHFFIVLGFVVGWLPFLVFEIRHGFQNITSIVSFVFHSGDTGAGTHFIETVFNVFFRLFARLLMGYPPPEQVTINQHFNLALWFYAALLLGIVSLLILLFKLFRAIAPRKKELGQRFSDFSKLSLLFLWFFIGIVLFGFYKKSIYDYYFGFMFPLPFLLVGNTIDFFIRKNKAFLVLAIAVLLSITVLNLNGIPFRYQPNRQLKQVETISRFVVDKTGNKPFNFALITGGNSDHAYRYFFTIWQRSPMAIEAPQLDPERKSVTDQLLVVCEALPCHPLGHSLWEIAGFGRAEIVGEWDVSVVKVYKLIHYKK